MDNLQSTTSSDQELPDEAQPAETAEPEREVLEGEVFQPRQQYGEAPEREEPEVSVEGEAEGSVAGGAKESVERGLAQYVFIREEREREVRLLLRDASPADIARTFRSAGAHLITLSAERASTFSSPIVATTPAESIPESDEDNEEDADSEVIERVRKRRTKQRSQRAGPPTGEVLLRYFFSLGEIVYTVSIVSPTGVTSSVASTYPLAARSERDLTQRLALVFI
ncbi:MAG TPA: hypothetical protein VJ183_18010 [Chloroflexia bacterium]|nr:hypothetical protein [Chloroflexia bacterium]